MALFPAATVTGKVIPLNEYPEPFQAADETTTSAFDADKVPVKDELLPTFTFPKLSVDGETVRAPTLLPLADWFCGPEDTPEQPVNTNVAVSATAPTMRRK